VVTYLIAEDGRIFSLSDVLPGGIEHARGAYDSGVSVGDASLSHRELCRAGLFVQDATSSSDGRLGMGKNVKAVRAQGKGWAHPALAARFLEPFESQRTRVAIAMDEPPETRPAGASFLFLRARVAAVLPNALVVRDAYDPNVPPVFLGPLFVQSSLPCLENLERLAVAGLALRVIARAPERGHILGLVAAAPEAIDEVPTICPPDTWASVCNVGFDRLQSSHVQRGLPAPRGETPALPDPLANIQRWLVRLLLGGRMSLPQAAHAHVRKDSALLSRAMMPEASARLRTLGDFVCGRGADSDVATAWAAAVLFERAARRVL
jgi:hypothetical protein